MPVANNGASEKKTESLEEIMFDFTMKQMDRSDIAWILESDKASMFDNRERVLLDNPQVLFYKDGELDSRLTAESGLLFPEIKRIIMTGDVVIAAADSLFIEADSLVWNNETERLSTESVVHLVDGASEMWGEGMEADAALEVVVLKKNVRGKSERVIIQEDEF